MTGAILVLEVDMLIVKELPTLDGIGMGAVRLRGFLYVRCAVCAGFVGLLRCMSQRCVSF